MQPIIHFEYYLENPQNTGDFYAKLFGWEINKWDGPVDYWLATTSKKPNPTAKTTGINGAFGNSNPQRSGVILTVSVPDIEVWRKKVEEFGGTLDDDVTQVPNVGLMCYGADPEGNKFGMMQEFG